jgi:hypothetical protein
MENDTSKKKRSFFDRRSGEDRRSTYNIDYFVEGGVERRAGTAGGRRNKENDRRKNWIKISPWSSLNIEDEKRVAEINEDSLDIE